MLLCCCVVLCFVCLVVLMLCFVVLLGCFVVLLFCCFVVLLFVNSLKGVPNGAPMVPNQIGPQRALGYPNPPTLRSPLGGADFLPPTPFRSGFWAADLRKTMLLQCLFEKTSKRGVSGWCLFGVSFRLIQMGRNPPTPSLPWTFASGLRCNKTSIKTRVASQKSTWGKQSLSKQKRR